MVGAGTGEPIRAIGMIRWQDLIASSRLLITAQNANAPPLPNSIRRSVSTAYYAMFHALAARNAECLISTPQGELGDYAWLRAYCGLDHREARRNLKQGRHLFSPPKCRGSLIHSGSYRTPATRRTMTSAERSRCQRP